MLFHKQDKVTLKLFAAMVDANKLERALDLVGRLHLEKSYEIAIQLADRHHTLADLVEEAKIQRFAVEEEEEEIEEEQYEEEEMDEQSHLSPDTTHIDRLASSRTISPEGGNFSKLERSHGPPAGDAFALVKRKRARLE